MLTCKPLHQIQSLGISVAIHNDKIRLTPAEKVNEEVRRIVNEHRADIVAALSEDPLDPFQASGEAIKVFLPPLDADVWFCADRQAADRVNHEELACFLYEDLVYIHQGEPGAERLSRLIEVYGKRHPIAQTVLDCFQGSRVTSVRSVVKEGTA